jgi:hypothetical protein
MVEMTANQASCEKTLNSYRYRLICKLRTNCSQCRNKPSLEGGRQCEERLPPANHFQLEIEYFSDCVLNSKLLPLLTLDDAKANNGGLSLPRCNPLPKDWPSS